MSIKIGLWWALFLVFLVLKLTGVIAWSWWWVTSPFWIPLGLALAAIFCVGVVVLFRQS